MSLRASRAPDDADQGVGCPRSTTGWHNPGHEPVPRSGPGRPILAAAERVRNARGPGDAAGRRRCHAAAGGSGVEAPRRSSARRWATGSRRRWRTRRGCSRRRRRRAASRGTTRATDRPLTSRARRPVIQPGWPAGRRPAGRASRLRRGRRRHRRRTAQQDPQYGPQYQAPTPQDPQWYGAARGGYGQYQQPPSGPYGQQPLRPAVRGTPTWSEPPAGDDGAGPRPGRADRRVPVLGCRCSSRRSRGRVGARRQARDRRVPRPARRRRQRAGRLCHSASSARCCWCSSVFALVAAARRSASRSRRVSRADRHGVLTRGSRRARSRPAPAR